MAVYVKIDRIIEGMESQSDESGSYLDTRTGQVVLVGDEELRAAEDGDDIEDFAEWQQEVIETAKEILEERGDFIRLPTKFDIHEYSIMEDFCWSLEEDDVRAALLDTIRGRGAFRYFKDAIHRYDISDKWYAHRDNRYKAIAIEWCEEHGIKYKG